jgi:hypothetical protein
MKRSLLNWPAAQTDGQVSEIAVLSPLKTGTVPGERRTFEERAMAMIANLSSRVQQGLPNELNFVPSIHFGRIMLIRPEQYLLYSDIPGIQYDPDTAGALKIPRPIDDYVEDTPRPGARDSQPPPALRSFLLTTVEFDGDIKVYFRDIGIFLRQQFGLIFCNCVDFPGTDNFEQFWLWIRRYQISTELFYSAYPNLSVVRIKQLELFKRNFDAFVARVRSPDGDRVQSMDELFDEFLSQNQQIAFGFPTPGGTFEPDGQQIGSL